MDKPNYRDPFIAMAFFACLFFIILVVIVVIWCKSRRKVEIKTVNIQPKKRPVTIKSVTSNGDTPSNGDRKLNADVEAGVISSEGITLETDDQTDRALSMVEAPSAVEAEEAEPSSQQTEERASNNQEPTADHKEEQEQKQESADNTVVDKVENDPIETADSKEQAKDSTTDARAEPPQQTTAPEGHSNPSFQTDEANDS